LFRRRWDTTLAITMDTYSHVQPNLQQNAVERLGALLM
jgi:hypothetical protein